MRVERRIPIGWVMMTLFAACMAEPDRTQPTFHRDVEPLLQQRCQECHRAGGAGPMALTEYESAKIYAPLIAARTRDRTMPPWGAFETPECAPRFPFRDDQRLTDEEIEMIAHWAEIGAPRGPSEDGPPPRAFSASSLAGADQELSPQQAFSSSGDRDQFRCFVLDPKNAIPTFVNGVSFSPGNPEVVHHAILFTDPHRDSLDLMGEDGSYECFGGPGVDDTYLLHAWAPGVPPSDFGSDLAMLLPENSLLVLQVHYHPGGRTHAPDRSTIELRYSESFPKYLLILALIGNFDDLDRDGDGLMPGENDTSGRPEFRIPAYATDHVETQRFTLPPRLDDFAIPDLKVLAVGSHMHYVGTDLKFDIEHALPKAGEPSTECMLHTPKWDFNWQRGYVYDVPIEDAPEFRPGDRMHIRCKYNNTLSNPAVVRALREQGESSPKDVFLGEETLDEMCLAVLMAAFPNPLYAESPL